MTVQAPTLLADLSASDATDLMKSGTLGPREYVSALLDRIQLTEPHIHAWATIDAARAIQQAAHLEKVRKQRRRSLLLYGVPIGVKDVIHVAGLPTAAGFALHSDHIATSDATVIQQLRAAGAIILGKTVTTPFAFSYDPPATRNPWNVNFSPGGSSSGSAAAVSARQVPIAIGTQTWGSMLRPCCYCGVVGLKPTFGRVSVAGVLPTSWSSDHVGIATRTVRDAALALGATYSTDQGVRSESSRSMQSTWPKRRRALAGLRLGLVEDLMERANKPVEAAVRHAINRLTDRGVEVVKIHLPSPMDFILAVQWIILSSEGAAIHASLHSSHASQLPANFRANVEVGTLIPAHIYVSAQRHHRRLRPAMRALLHGVNALVAPTAPDQAPALDSGARLGDASFQAVWTGFGFPNITVPTGVGRNGLPHGIQLIGRPDGDQDLLRIADACASEFDIDTKPPDAN